MSAPPPGPMGACPPGPMDAWVGPMGACPPRTHGCMGRTHVSRDSCTHKPMRALRRWCQMMKGREGKGAARRGISPPPILGPCRPGGAGGLAAPSDPSARAGARTLLPPERGSLTRRSSDGATWCSTRPRRRSQTGNKPVKRHTRTHARTHTACHALTTLSVHHHHHTQPVCAALHR